MLTTALVAGGLVVYGVVGGGLALALFVAGLEETHGRQLQSSVAVLLQDKLTKLLLGFQSQDYGWW